MRLVKPARVTQNLSEIPDGKSGIIATLKAMRAFVKSGKKALPIRTLALRIVKPIGEKQWLKEAAAIHDYVSSTIRFVRDIRDVETLHDAERVLLFGQGDCDDKSVLFASLVESIGHPTRFCAVGFFPDTYEHVYTETLIGRKWVASDTTEKRGFGWGPPNVVSKLIIYN